MLRCKSSMQQRCRRFRPVLLIKNKNWRKRRLKYEHLRMQLRAAAPLHSVRLAAYSQRLRVYNAVWNACRRYEASAVTVQSMESLLAHTGAQRLGLAPTSSMNRVGHVCGAARQR